MHLLHLLSTHPVFLYCELFPGEGSGGAPQIFWWGYCNPVLQPLTLFQTKYVHVIFQYPFQTSPVMTIPIFSPYPLNPYPYANKTHSHIQASSVLIHTYFQTFSPKGLKSIPMFRQNSSKTIPLGAAHTYIPPLGLFLFV